MFGCAPVVLPAEALAGGTVSRGPHPVIAAIDVGATRRSGQRLVVLVVCVQAGQPADALVVIHRWRCRWRWRWSWFSRNCC